MYDENWWRELKVGDVVCDCRYRHLRIKEIENEIYPDIPKWLLNILYNELIPHSIISFVEPKVHNLLKKFNIVELGDKMLTLEDGSMCSATNCCSSPNHETSSHKGPIIRDCGEEAWVEFKQDFIDRVQAQVDKPARMTKDQFRVLFTEGRLLLEEPDSELADDFGVSHPTIDRWMRGVTCPAPVARASYLKKLLRWVKKENVAIYTGFTPITFQDTKRELEEIEARLAKEFGISKENVRVEIRSREKTQTLEDTENVKQWQQTYDSYLDWVAIKDDLISEINSALELASIDKELFTRLFIDGRCLLSASDQELAQNFGISTEVIVFWMNGDVCPAAFGRALYLGKLLRWVEKENG